MQHVIDSEAPLHATKGAPSNAPTTRQETRQSFVHGTLRLRDARLSTSAPLRLTGFRRTSWCFAKLFVLYFAAALLFTSVLALGEATSLPPPIRITSGVSGHIHPTLCLTRQGTLVATFCKKEYQPYLITRSTDRGQSWSEPTLVPYTTDTSIYPGSLTTLADGRLVHAWNVWFSTEAKTQSRYVAFSVSTDDGLTWSEPKNLQKDIDPKIHSVIRHPLVELSPTSWLFPLADRTILYNPETGQETPFGEPTSHGLVPMVPTPSGTLVSGRGKRSTDAGQTWQDVKPFPDIFTQGWRHEMIALKNGWLLASQIVGPGVGGERIEFIVSRDDGQSWDLTHPVEFYNPRRPIGGRACPRTVQIDDQTLGTIFYDTDEKQPGGSGLFFRTTPLSNLAPPKPENPPATTSPPCLPSKRPIKQSVL